jgi:tetrahydromethanopterin S-methyltransferase subunit G
MKTEDSEGLPDRAALDAARGIIYGAVIGAAMWLISAVVYAVFAN